MKIFLTGGTGFFGKALLRYFKTCFLNNYTHAPELVVVMSRNPTKFLENNPEFNGIDWLKFHKGNILDTKSFPNEHKLTHVIHAAADSTEAHKLQNIERFYQIVDGTRNVLDYAVKKGIKRFLLTSSGAVYGKQPNDIDLLPEAYLGMPDPLDPSNTYGVAKRMAEHLCVLYSEKFNLHTLVARCFAFTGQDLPLDAHFAIGNFIRDALIKDSIIISGDGKPLRSYLHQNDLAQWLLTILMQGRNCEAYNVGSDQAITILELATLIRNELAPQKEIIVALKNISNIPGHRYVPNIDKAKYELDLIVSVPLIEAIHNTALAVKIK
jgi:dTDP-glucose 4,6-dehydratase